MDRRRPGQSPIVSQRKEPDTVRILSGTFDGKTLGTVTYGEKTAIQDVDLAIATLQEIAQIDQDDVLALYQLVCDPRWDPLFDREDANGTRISRQDLLMHRGGVLARAAWRDVMGLNLHGRLAQRVLVQLSHTPYRNERDLYEAASAVAWDIWFTTRQSFKIEITAQHSPLTSLNFAALKIKDAVADRFRHKTGVRPDVDTRWPDVRIYAHLTTDTATLYIDTSGEPLFKRGWREDTGEAPLKETLAAAMIAASGWDAQAADGVPLYDPCCGSGTIAIEAAQIACGIAAGSRRRFAFEKLLPFQPHVWQAMKEQAKAAEHAHTAPVFGSDVAHRMVDFAQRNAERAGVAHAVSFRGGDALQRLPPCESPGVMLLNPPYGERIAAAGVAGARETMAPISARCSLVGKKISTRAPISGSATRFLMYIVEIPRFKQESGGDYTQ
mgnify:CR=1 FL=1